MMETAMPKPINFRQYKGKRMLSLIRGGDYAHAGEEEAIDLCMRPFPKDNTRSVLDIGCGLGKTAEYMHHSGYGQVTGVDIEEESIGYAKQYYSACQFHTVDAHKIAGYFQRQFDIVTLFNSFYAFHNQSVALAGIHTTLKPRGKIMIFDYTDLTGDNSNPLYRAPDAANNIPPFYPLHTDVLCQTMQNGGWYNIEIVDISANYEIWYINLVKKLLGARDAIVTEFDKNFFGAAFALYSKILSALIARQLGGAIIYAEKA